MLHHQGLFNRCQYNFSWEGTAFDIPVVGEVMAISVTPLLPIKPTFQYCRDSPWRGQHVSVTPAKVIILDYFFCVYYIILHKKYLRFQLYYISTTLFI
jgi:hypothetical protein